jgi:hypothetical protein
MIKVGKAALLFPIFFALLCGNAAVAQKIEIGGSLGATSYKGDIMPNYGLSTSLPAGAVFVRQNFSPAFTLKYNLMLGGIRGNGRNSPDPYTSTYAEPLELKFRSPLLELGAHAEYNFFNYREERYRRWTPYAFMGLGVMYHRADAPREQEAPFPIQPVIPMGIGAKVVFAKQWNLGIELGARKTFTNYLDGAASVDIPTNLQRGNPFTNDWYLFSGISISYTIYTIPCPFDSY